MTGKLTKLLSRNRNSYVKEKEAEAEAEAVRKTNGLSSSPPPSYAQQPPDLDADNILDPPDVTAGFKNLTLNASSSDVPQVGQCIAHLKVLECFYRLRQKVGSSNGLFEINDQVVYDQGLPEDQNGELLAKLAEKRWAIYVSRAADRFDKWSAATNAKAQMITQSELRDIGMSGTLCDPPIDSKSMFEIDRTNMPPADVLMVWHAYMLNPRAYLEDCIRFGRMSMWHAGFPWQAIVDSINSETFAFEADYEANEKFQALTGLPWDNLDDLSGKHIDCPSCGKTAEVPLTTCPDYLSKIGVCGNKEKASKAIDEALSSGRGFCDVEFAQFCTACQEDITHEKLKVHKFRSDVRALLERDVPMAGTILGVDGIPHVFEKQRDWFWRETCKVPNDILSVSLGREILNQPISIQTMNSIRDLAENILGDRVFLRSIPNTRAGVLGRQQRVGIRKMMSRYWENHSRFALDLVGAVIRQGTFIEKMHNIDWLHSPALPSTMKRLLVKYQRFVTLMTDKRYMAVPTLDVDLAWHTHQLSPYMYMKHTISVTRQFIDHDDKVPETKLNDAFAWTSKIYQKRYNEPYSECTCWYCEAIRESHTSAASRMFNTSSAQVNEQLHNADQDPRKSVHISAHNAVRPADKDYEKSAALKAEALEKQYQDACKRARKKGRKEPKRDDYYYSDAYGYPVYIPAYAPYMYGYWGLYTPMYYPVTPGCMAVTSGAYGNCCSGTCSAGTAAGACGGGAGGGCAGGGAACGGGGGGGCGGGGGGGCGGGGGGGGCGGGGGA